MPLALLVFGVVLLIAGVRDSQDKLFGLVKGDFSGQSNFVYWTMAILAIGAVGYIPKAKPISEGFLVLVVLVLFLHNKGVWTNVSAALQSTTTAQAATSPTSSTASGLNVTDYPAAAVSSIFK